MNRLLALVAALLTATLAVAAPTKSGRVEVNGVNYYYEIHGPTEIGSRPSAATAAAGTKTGEMQPPLLLLHGGLGSIDMFGPVLPALAKTRKVIASTCTATGAPRSAIDRSASRRWATTWRRS